MDRSLVDRIAEVVLYEGYMLYPYRPALKNRQRWTFGGVYPQSYSQSQGDSEPWFTQTECLVQGTEATRLNVRVHFLHVIERLVAKLDEPAPERDAETHLQQQGRSSSPLQMVQSLEVDGKWWHSWQEAREREIALEEVRLADLAPSPSEHTFCFEAHSDREPLWSSARMLVGMLLREQHALEGRIELSAEPVGAELWRLRVRIENHTPMPMGDDVSRHDAAPWAFASSHTIFEAADGAFVSLLDPPDDCRAAAAACRNIGAWPVLVGQEGERDGLLSAPIILYDYPQIAPESPGEFFDGTEIDEMLALRVLTLTEEEKRAMGGLDDRTRKLLERTQALSPERMRALHGALRGVPSAAGEGPHG
jgi:hydrogenase maturation protease